MYGQFQMIVAITSVLYISYVLEYKYKKRLLLRCIHHFKSDLINNMDHMRISGTERKNRNFRIFGIFHVFEEKKNRKTVILETW